MIITVRMTTMFVHSCMYKYKLSHSMYYLTLPNSMDTEVISIEQKVENYCHVVVKTDAEDWEKRNRALTQMTDLFGQFMDRSREELNVIFTAHVYRCLKEPIKLMVTLLHFVSNI